MRERFHRKERAAGAAGFTLTEVLVASALSVLVMAGVVTAFAQYSRAIKSQKLEEQVHQNLRFGAMYLIRDLSMAGYGLRISDADLSRWITWSPLSSNPEITAGAGDAPDEVSMAAAYDNLTSLSQVATARTDVIVVAPGTGREFDTSVRKVIYIGRCELARIRAISGDRLTVSTSPDRDQGLRFNHPVGTSVELVKVYTYSIFTPPSGSGLPICLQRVEEGRSSSYWFENIAAAGVEHLQADRDGEMIRFALRGRSTEIDPSYTDPIYNDNYRRMTLEDQVYLRNLQP